MSTPRSCPTVAVVGAGAAGTLTAAHLARAATEAHRNLELLLVDPRPSTGAGTAYSTRDTRHRLNVRAGGMSAWSDDADHFVRWLRTERDPATGPTDFVPRADYGAYLAAVLDDAVAQSGGRVRLDRRYERATAATARIGPRRRRGGAAAVRPGSRSGAGAGHARAGRLGVAAVAVRPRRGVGRPATDPGGSAGVLWSLRDDVWRLGGSAAQREIVEETLLYALIQAGWSDHARLVLERRLDRRPSRRDVAGLRRLDLPPSERSGSPAGQGR
jgi:hypothetical protein